MMTMFIFGSTVPLRKHTEKEDIICIHVFCVTEFNELHYNKKWAEITASVSLLVRFCVFVCTLTSLVNKLS